MSFLNPALLFGLFALGIPIAIHLLNRRRFQTVKWGATAFLLKATRESRGRKRLRHILILAARALAIAFLVLAVARPLLSGFLGWRGSQVDQVILLLDRSPTMEAKVPETNQSKRQTAIQQIISTYQQIKAESLILIDSVTNQPQLVLNPENLLSLTNTGPSDTSADIPKMLLQATTHLQSTPSSAPEIWIVTDLQKTNWHPEDSRWEAIRTALDNLPTPPRIRILSKETPPEKNSSIRILRTTRHTSEIEIEFQINCTDQADPKEFILTMQGINTSVPLDLSNLSNHLTHRFPIPKGASTGSGSLNLLGDDNEQDNHAYFTFQKIHQSHTLLVTPSDPSELSSNEILLRAAAPPNLSQFTANTLPSDKITVESLTGTDLVIWEDVLPNPKAFEMLTSYLREGGTVLFLPPSPTSTPLISPPKDDTPATFLGHHWTATSDAPPNNFFRTEDWIKNDGPWRNSINGSPLPLPSIQVIRRQVPKGSGIPLATFTDNAPLLLRHHYEKGSTYFLATHPDLSWSNLEHTGLHLVLVHRLLSQAASDANASHLVHPGSPVFKSSTFTRIDLQAGVTNSDPQTHAGVYQASNHLVASNRPPDEDIAEILPFDALHDLLAPLPYTLLKDRSQDKKRSFVREIWRPFLIAMLFMLLAETLLCLPAKSRSLKNRPSLT